MADALSASFTHTYAGKESIREIFYQPEENVPTVESMYRIMDVVDKKNVYIAQDLRKILRVYSTCGFTAAGGVFTLTDKTISTEKVKVNMSHCVDQWVDTIFAEEMRTGVDVDNMQGTVIDTVLKNQLFKGIRSDIHRIVWFATAADADADWTHFDGFIQLFLDSSATIGASCFVDSDGTSFETSDALATDGSLGLLKQLYAAMSKALRMMNDKQFYVTYTVYDNLMDTYEDTQSGVGLLRLIDGTTQLSFRGIPVVPVPEWDINLADSTNPHYTGSGLSIGSNLIVLTTPQNLIVGTDVSSPSNEFKFRYNDDDSELLKIISKFNLGAQFVHPELICVAY